ncbi:MAG: hypothetical protein WC637_07085 [Victivallales bacterium]|jgi:hypothetical protein
MRKTIALALIFIICLTSNAEPFDFDDIGILHNYNYTVFQIGVAPRMQLFGSRTKVYGISSELILNYNSSKMYGLRLAPFAYQWESYAIALSLFDEAGHNYGIILSLADRQY